MIREAYAQINPPGPLNNKDPQEAFSYLLGLAFQVVLIVAAIYAILQIIFAGYGMISSGGDKGALEAARGKIIWAVIGLIIVLASWGFIILAENLLDICLGFSCPINLTPQ